MIKFVVPLPHHPERAVAPATRISLTPIICQHDSIAGFKFWQNSPKFGLVSTNSSEFTKKTVKFGLRI
jgi:hypothetical protein